MASASNYQAWVEVLPEFKGFNKDVKQTTERTLGDAGTAGGKLFGAGLTGALGIAAGAVAVAGAAAVAGVGVALGKTVSAGLDRSLNIQDATAKLTGLGHSAESVQTIMDSALASVKGTAFGLGDAAAVAAGAVASGIEPGERLTKVLKLTADAATIAGTDLNSMGSIFNKVAASGKLQGDVIAQLQDAGVPVLQLVAKQMGVTAGEAAKLASEGKVSFETFSDAMEQGLGGAALSSGKTARGAFANLEAAVGRFGAKFTDPIVAAAPAFFGAITAGLDGAAAAAGPFATAFGVKVAGGLEQASGKITDFLAKIGEVKPLLADGDISGAFQSLFDLPENFPIVAILDTYGEAIEKFKGAFAGFGEGIDLPQLLLDLSTSFSPLATVLTGLLPVIPVIAEGVGEFARTLGDGLLDAATQLLPPLTDLSTALSDGIAAIVTDPALATSLTGLVDAFGELGTTTLPTLVPVVVDLVEALGPLVPIVSELISAGLPVLVDLLTFLVTPTRESSDASGEFATQLDLVGLGLGALLQLLPGGLVAFAALRDLFTGARTPVELMSDALNGKFGLAVQGAGNLAIQFGQFVRQGFLSAQAGVQDALGNIQAVGQRVWSALPAPVQTALSTIGTTVSTGISGAVSTIASLPGRAIAALSGLGSALVGAGRSLVEGFVDGITGGIQSAANAAARVARAAVDAAKAALDINSPSRVFRDQVGLMVGLGMAEGIDKSAGAVQSSVSKLALVPDVPSRAFAYSPEVLGSGVVSGGGITQENSFVINESTSATATAIAVSRRMNGFAV